MILASAQTLPKQGNIPENIRDHCRFARIAAAQGAEFIIFPELSLTGYVIEEATQYAFSEQDSRLSDLRELATSQNITIVAGAPLALDGELYIGSCIFLPDGSMSIYTKQFLHAGEEKAYMAGSAHNPQIPISNKLCSLAICADITHPEHAANAAQAGSSVYAAGIFYTPRGIAQGHSDLQSYAATYSMNVLMANYGGPSYNAPSAGRSAFWANSGECLAQLPPEGEALLIVRESESGWETMILTNLREDS